MTDALWIAWWFACAVWARLTFHAYVELVAGWWEKRYAPRHVAAEALTGRLAQTVADVGWNRPAEHTMFYKSLGEMAR